MLIMKNLVVYSNLWLCFILIQLVTVHALRRDEVPDETVEAIRKKIRKHMSNEFEEPDNDDNFRDPHEMFKYDARVPKRSPDEVKCDCSSIQNDLNTCLEKLSRQNATEQSEGGNDHGKENIKKDEGTSVPKRNSREEDIRKTGHGSGEKVGSSDNEKQSVEMLYFKRAVMLIGNELKERAPDGHPATIQLQFSADAVDTLKTYAREPAKDGLFAYRTLMIALERITIDYSEDLHPPFYHSFRYSLVPTWLQIIIGLMIAIFFRKLLRKFMPSTRSVFVSLITFCVSLVFVSIVWNFIYLYKLEATEAEYVTLKGMPDSCSEQEQGFFATFLSFFRNSDHECKEYYKMKNIHPLFKVSPVMAMARTFSTLVFHPMVEFSHSVSHIIDFIIGKHSLFGAILILNTLAIFFTILVMIFTGYGFNTILVSFVAPARSPLRMIAEGLLRLTEIPERHPPQGLPERLEGARVEDAHRLAQDVGQPAVVQPSSSRITDSPTPAMERPAIKEKPSSSDAKIPALRKGIEQNFTSPDLASTSRVLDCSANSQQAIQDSPGEREVSEADDKSLGFVEKDYICNNVNELESNFAMLPDNMDESYVIMGVTSDDIQNNEIDLGGSGL